MNKKLISDFSEFNRKINEDLNRENWLEYDKATSVDNPDKEETDEDAENKEEEEDLPKDIKEKGNDLFLTSKRVMELMEVDNPNKLLVTSEFMDDRYDYDFFKETLINRSQEVELEPGQDTMEFRTENGKLKYVIYFTLYDLDGHKFLELNIRDAMEYNSYVINVDDYDYFSELDNTKLAKVNKDDKREKEESESMEDKIKTQHRYM